MILLFGTDPNVLLGSIITQTLSYQLHICPRVVHVGFMVNKRSLRQVFVRKLRFYFASYHSINVPYSPIISKVGVFIGHSTEGLGLTPLLLLIKI